MTILKKITSVNSIKITLGLVMVVALTLLYHTPIVQNLLAYDKDLTEANKSFSESNSISESLLLAVKEQNPTEKWVQQLESIPFSKLESDLDSDNLKKAFWINIYNSFYQILRKTKNLTAPEIFTEKVINVAGSKLSLDDIEHGILRRNSDNYTLGYLTNLFVPDAIKKLKVAKVDYRIHFALNCGAKSCPPIAFYASDKIERQLEVATLSFLESETNVDKEKNEIHISRLFLWFSSDFGGEEGIRNILKEKLKIETDGYKLIYKEYSWEEHLDNYSNTF